MNALISLEDTEKRVKKFVLKILKKMGSPQTAVWQTLEFSELDKEQEHNVVSQDVALKSADFCRIDIKEGAKFWFVGRELSLKKHCSVTAAKVQGRMGDWLYPCRMVLKRDICNTVGEEKEGGGVTFRFMREWKFLNKFKKLPSKDRPFFSWLVGVLLEKEAPVLVMPYYRFGNLKAYLLRSRALESKQKQLWIRQLWTIGNHLRNLRVGHRNIEPSNFCLTRDPGRKLFSLVLVDWKCAVLTFSADMKKNGHLVGGSNLEYQPPEVVLGYGAAANAGPHWQDE